MLALSAVSTTDIWAVGDTESRPVETIASHWNGSTWARVPTPNRASRSLLADVVALRSDDAWAVGRSEGRDGLGGALIEHWNGTRWSVVPSHAPRAAATTLTSVSALSADDVWAVGYRFTERGELTTLAEHWDGARWTTVHSWNDPALGGTLAAVEAVSADDVWAVGSAGQGLTTTLIEHWDGTTWRHVPSPNPGGPDAFNDLMGITAVSPSDVWAVGGYTTATRDRVTLALHWAGHHWHQVSTPSPPGSSDSFVGIDATRATNSWAVGGTGDAALIEHWDGTGWHRVSSPDPRHKYLGDVAVLSAHDAWSVGGDFYRHRTLIEHWDGQGWSQF